MKKENMVFRLKLDNALANEMVSKLPESLFLSDCTSFLDPSMGGGQYVVAIEDRLRKMGHSDANIKNRVFGVEKSQLRVNYAINKNNLVGTYNIDKSDIPNILINNMKFDCIVGNPPYNAPKALKDGSKKMGGGTTLWDKFIYNSFRSLNDCGYLCMVHPIGWRSFTGDYAGVAEIYTSNNLIYVSMNDYSKGLKTFSAGTAYDVVICQKSQYQKKTIMVDFDGNQSMIDVTRLSCIPSGKLNEILPLLAKDNEERCEVLYSRSAYGSDKPNVSETKSVTFKYPVVHAINVKNEPTFLYSDVNNKRLSREDFRPMFGVPKVIFARWSGTIIDQDGEYGCSQDTRAIVDTKKNLPKILKAIRSEKFINLMRYLNWGSGMPDTYNKEAFKLFRKDFWKDFV
jgi:hypothetical protein